MFTKYVGLTAEASALIEQRRARPDQTESDIIVETLRLPGSGGGGASVGSNGPMLDLGQGVRLRAGERLYLFLNEQTKKTKKPDGLASVGEMGDGLYVEGKRVKNSRGTPLAAAMHIFQQRQGKLTSLSAWRQWHVLRGDRFVALVELKDPELAHRRGRPVDVDALLAELGREALTGQQ